MLVARNSLITQSISEIVQSKTNSHVQNAVTHVEKWSSQNKLQLNEKKCKKCKELIIDFNFTRVVDPLTINGNLLNVLKHQKIIGLYTSSDLQLNIHIVESIKKADKRMYFLVLLKLSGVSSSDIRNFFCTCITHLAVRILFASFPSLPPDLFVGRLGKRSKNSIGHYFPKPIIRTKPAEA